MVNDIGKRLLKIRTDMALTQVKMAKLLGVNQVNVSNWENGRHRPSAETLHRYSKVTGMSVYEVMYGRFDYCTWKVLDVDEPHFPSHHQNTTVRVSCRELPYVFHGDDYKEADYCLFCGRKIMR